MVIRSLFKQIYDKFEDIKGATLVKYPVINYRYLNTGL
jgi:hypothetical protein